MGKRDSFVFYRSFFECINELPSKGRETLLIAVCKYALDGVEPSLKGLEKGIFSMIRPQIDANNKRYENGKKGGRPRGKPNENQEITEEEPNENQNETKGFNSDNEFNNQDNNQTETKLKPNENVNVNVNVNVNDNDITPISPLERFEYFWVCYPLDKNKCAAEKAYCDVVQDGIYTEDDLVDAAKNYAEYCKLLNTQKRFIKTPAKWLSETAFEDYLPGRYEKPQIKAKEDANAGIMRQNYDIAALEKELMAN